MYARTLNSNCTLVRSYMSKSGHSWMIFKCIIVHMLRDFIYFLFRLTEYPPFNCQPFTVNFRLCIKSAGELEKLSVWSIYSSLEHPMTVRTSQRGYLNKVGKINNNLYIIFKILLLNFFIVTFTKVVFILIFLQLLRFILLDTER